VQKVKQAGDELDPSLHEDVFQQHIPSGIIKYFNTLEITHSKLKGVQRIHAFPFEFKPPNPPERFHNRNPLDVVAVMSSACAETSEFQFDVHGVEYAQVLLFFTMKVVKGAEQQTVKAAYVKYFDTFADSKGAGKEVQQGNTNDWYVYS